MAAISKTSLGVGPSSDLPQNCKLTLPAGEDIDAGEAVYITSDAEFELCEGDADSAEAEFYGIALTSAKAGEAVTAAHSCRIPFASGQTPGSLAYLSPTVPGGLDTANAVITRAVGRFVDGSRLQVFGPFDGEIGYVGS